MPTDLRYRGADVSMLPVLEAAGARFADDRGNAELVTLLASRGVNLFRLRLFVDPNLDYNATHGAVQELTTTIALAKRVKAAGRELLLDLHYSDTWADPEHQSKPRAWKDLHGDALERKVYDYTVETLGAFKAAGVMPEMVQVGNEITPGMLFPDGQIVHGSTDAAAESWAAFGQLLNVGIRGVRAAQDQTKPIVVMVHIHGGGKKDLPVWFFERITKHVTDFQIVGLSFYPDQDETVAHLRTNLLELAARFDRDIVIAETAYPNRRFVESKPEGLDWPTTVAGQRAFLLDLRRALATVPGGRGVGFIYWYPEAIELPNLWTWRGGGLATFDKDGKPLPALDAFAPTMPRE